MGRSSCVLFVIALCVGAVAVRGHEDSWFPDPFKWDSPPTPDKDPPPKDKNPPPLYPAPNGPSPYYDTPPYGGGDPPVKAPSPYYGYPPTYGPDPSPWLSSGLWAQKTDAWPSPWTADTSVGDAFGSDAVTVYGQISLLDGVSSKSEDGYSDLLKEGITALLNTADKHYKYSEDDVKEVFSFKTGLNSESAATHQASLFHAANEAYLNP